MHCTKTKLIKAEARHESDSAEPSATFFRRIFSQPCVLNRQLERPLLAQRETYLRHLVELGRPEKAVAEIATVILHIVRLTGFDGRSIVSETRICEAAELWLTEAQGNPRVPAGSSARNLKSQARAFLKFFGCYVGQGRGFIFEEKLSQYASDMRRCCLPTTVTSNVYTIRNFLRWAQTRHSDLRSITTTDVDCFMAEKRADGWQPRTFVGLCRALRSFFRYSESHQWTESASLKAIKAPWYRARQKAPHGPTWSQIRRRIAALDVNDPVECRAKAVMLLAAVYGLRTCEIARLTLDDLDWYHEVMTVRRAKRGRIQQFPLQYEVGEAIIQYLLKVRPACSTRHVFVTMTTPYRPAINLGGALRMQLKGHGVFQKPCGLHSLRHACATELLRKGTSLRGIADFLGHRDLRSVSIYAHCNVRVLRKVAAVSLKGFV